MDFGKFQFSKIYSENIPKFPKKKQYSVIFDYSEISDFSEIKISFHIPKKIESELELEFSIPIHPIYRPSM